MSRPVFVDTSYLLALLNSHDTFHQQALLLAEQIHGKLITTEAVLTEIGNGLSKIQWRALAVATLNDLRKDENVVIVPSSPALFSNALELYATRMDKEWGLTDCISFVVMRKHKLTDALTTDRHFEQAGFKVLLQYV